MSSSFHVELVLLAPTFPTSFSYKANQKKLLCAVAIQKHVFKIHFNTR